MLLLICLLTAGYFGLLLAEAHRAKRDRAAIPHIVHVNGIRGKSTTARLIAAGLSGGRLAVFCKTTGTDPITIDCLGREEPIRRVGCTNIREQLAILHRAAAQGAQVLVVECMAVQPQLQYTAQHRMLLADIGVITNVRRDHTDVMGDTLPQIAASLANTVPRGGVLFTAEHRTAEPLRRAAQRLGSRFVQTAPDGTEPPELPFAENVALALAVCAELGVSRRDALAGMAQYHPDPYALSVYRLGQSLFVNALSANDIQSTQIIWQRMLERYGQAYPGRVLLLNNRADRGARTQDMLQLAIGLAPATVLLMGAQQAWLAHRLAKALPNARVVRSRALPDLDALPPGSLCFAAGNIAGRGRALLAAVAQKGERLV